MERKKWERKKIGAWPQAVAPIRWVNEIASHHFVALNLKPFYQAIFLLVEILDQFLAQIVLDVAENPKIVDLHGIAVLSVHTRTFSLEALLHLPSYMLGHVEKIVKKLCI